MTALAGRLDRHAGLLLAVAVAASYLPSLGGGFLNYDDPWLVAGNPLLRDGGARALAAIWTDLSLETRLTLGAEDLPLRDTLQWLEARAHGLEPHAMRATSLGLYLAAVLVMRGLVCRLLGPGMVAEGAAWLFALHPVHVESVAWLSGRKDVISLLLVALALYVHARRSRHRVWLVPLLFVLAALGKSAAVVAPLLLPLHDRLAHMGTMGPAGQCPPIPHATGRPVDRGTFLASLGGCLAIAGVHLEVGRAVEMTGSLPGGSRLAAAATMGPVFLRYLGNVLWPSGLSVVYDVEVRGAADASAFMAYVPLVAWAAAGVALWRRGRPLALASLAWFVVPLLPTSQVVFPLQNLMADRYLVLGVLGPVTAAVVLLGMLPGRRAAMTAVGACAALLAVATAYRASRFADSVLLWQDATAKTTLSTVAPYQLGLALEESGRFDEAIAAYTESVQRAGPGDDNGRKAANNLAARLATLRRLADAERILRRAVAQFPDDPKVLNNLAEIVARRGDLAEGRRLYGELLRRFPGYDKGRRNYDRRYGPPPPASGALPDPTRSRPGD